MYSSAIQAEVIAPGNAPPSVTFAEKCGHRVVEDRGVGGQGSSKRTTTAGAQSFRTSKGASKIADMRPMAVSTFQRTVRQVVEASHDVLPLPGARMRVM